MSKKAVFISCFHYYENRICFIEKLLKEQGYECVYITSDFDHIRKQRFCAEVPGCIQVPTKPYRKNMTVDRILSHICFAKDVFGVVEEIGPDFLFVMVPPNSLGGQAAKYKKKHPNVRLVLDIYDLWPETFPVGTTIKKLMALPFGFWRTIRTHALPAADAITTECDMYQEVLQKWYPREKMHTLYLARKKNLLRADWNPPSDKIALCYLGSINSIIDIPRIGEIVRKIGAPVELHVIGDGERREELLETAKAAGADVIFHGKVFDPAEKQAIFDKCHAGLNVMKDSVYVGLTMKSIDYFEGSLPIINTIKGDTWSFVEQNPIGINYTEETMLSADMLCSLQSSRAQVRTFFESNFTETIFAKQAKAVLDKITYEI